VGTQRVAHDALGSAVGHIVAGSLRTSGLDAWGNYTSGSPQPGEPTPGFARQTWDPDARLSNAQQRWYTPGIGRFLSEDPVGAVSHRLQSGRELDGFAYAGGNPLRWVDPTGTLIFDASKNEWRVEEDDTIETIAQDTGFDVNDILSANSLGSSNVCLLVGSPIQIPQTRRIKTFEAAARSIGSRNWENTKEHRSDPMADCAGVPAKNGQNSAIVIPKSSPDRCNVAVVEWIEECGGQRLGRMQKSSRKPWKREYWTGYEAVPLAQDFASPDNQIEGTRVRTPEEQPKIGDAVAGSHDLGHGGHMVVYAGNIRVIRKDGKDARDEARKEEPRIDELPGAKDKQRGRPSSTMTIGTSGSDQIIRTRHLDWMCGRGSGMGQQTFICDPSTWPPRTVKRPFEGAMMPIDPSSGWHRLVRTTDDTPPGEP
jgi:RHS repeat-associated protein